MKAVHVWGIKLEKVAIGALTEGACGAVLSGGIAAVSYGALI